MKTDDLDIVYCVKASPINEELRFSLRSLVNIPHRKVWIFGYAPQWAKNIEYIEQQQEGFNKWEKCGYSLRSICLNDNITEDFIWFNDDFFVIKPVEELSYYIDRTLDDRILDLKRAAYNGVPSRYALRLQDASNALKQNNRTNLNYELHIPMIFNRKKLLSLWEQYPDIGAHRSLYGNEYNVGGKQRSDVKIYDNYHRLNKEIDFLSTTDRSFSYGKVGQILRNTFNRKCKYER